MFPFSTKFLVGINYFFFSAGQKSLFSRNAARGVAKQPERRNYESSELKLVEKFCRFRQPTCVLSFAGCIFVGRTGSSPKTAVHPTGHGHFRDRRPSFAEKRGVGKAY